MARNNFITYKNLECPDKELSCVLEKVIPNYVTIPEVNSPLTDITYSELVSLIGSNGLVAGSYYRITDFQTVHYIVDSNGVKYSINTGILEPLIVFALNTNTISCNVYSESYPQDIIHYDWNPSNHLTDVSFATASVIITGWKGVITFRHDTKQDNYTGYDFRNVKFRRWKLATPTWVIGTTYSEFSPVVYNEYIYFSLKNSNIGNTPVNGSSYWVRSIELSKNEYWGNNSVEFATNTPLMSSVEFEDFLTFAEVVGSYEGSVKHVYIENNSVTNTYPSFKTILGNNVFFITDLLTKIKDVVIGSNSFGNTIQGRFEAIVVDMHCSVNIWFNNNSWTNYGSYLESNILCGGESTFAQVCVYNVLPDFYELRVAGEMGGSIAGNNFFANIIGDELSAVVGNNCQYNNFIGYGFRITAGDDFKYNNMNSDFGGTFGNNCKYNNFENSNYQHSSVPYSNNLQRNTFKSYFNSVANINFAGATHIYNPYDCTLFTDSAGVQKLSYINGSGVLTVVLPTA